jgi:hypothetical protein
VAPARPDQEALYEAPRTPVEEGLARIWSDLLGLAWVGIHDNFFDLGGHSLLAVRVISHVRTSFGVELPLRTVFETPILGDLAVAIVQALVERLEPRDRGL